MNRINTESERLEREEEKAEEQMMAAQVALNEALNRLARLRRQKRALKSKGEEMVRRGLQSLDELEEAEQNEASAEEVAHLDGSFRDYSAEAQADLWSSLGLGDFVLPVESGGTPPISSG